MPRLAAAVIAIAVLGGCFNAGWEGGRSVDGSGVAGSRTVDVPSVEGVRLAVSGRLTVMPGAAPLRVEGDDNVVERLEVSVDGGVLDVRAPRGESFRPELPLRMTVGSEALRGVEVAGSGSVHARGVRASDVAVSVAGSGDARVSGLDARSVSVEVGGSGSVRLDGRSVQLSVSVAGSGDVEARDLAVSTAEVSVAGSGDVTVRVADRLSATVVGSGDVRYVGSPEVSQSVTGSGDVEPDDG